MGGAAVFGGARSMVALPNETWVGFVANSVASARTSGGRWSHASTSTER